MTENCSEPIELGPSQSVKVHLLETAIGAEVVAVQPGCQWAQLSPDKLAKLQEAESEMGVLLLAYNKK